MANALSAANDNHARRSEMSEQPALRLADVLDEKRVPTRVDQHAAAAELRRQHAEAEAFKGAEPVATVAEVHMSRYTLEWTNGPLPEGTKLYTHPAAPANTTTDAERGTRTVGLHGGLKECMPSPSQAEQDSPLFKAIWSVAKNWDVNAPEHYVGYCGFNGSHAKLLMDAITAAKDAT
jgi:hypothetical protein